MLKLIDVVGAVFSRVHEDKAEIALFQRKADDSGGGLWEFPGGKVEEGETFEVALVREINEELEIPVVVESLLGNEQYQYPGSPVRLNFFAYWVSAPHFRWVLNDHSQFCWVDAENWQKLPIAPVDIPLLQKAFRQLQEGSR